MKRALKWVLIAVAGLLLAAFIGLGFLAGGPKNAYEMARYALPYMHIGHLKVGDSAPDVQLVALDGKSRFQLRGHLAGRPLVLIFGSFT
jgi:hypothetical protein